jgi:nucleolar protein 53
VKHLKNIADAKQRATELKAATKSVTADITDQAVIQAREENLLESGDETVLSRRKLGNTVIPEKKLEVVLHDELQESLRWLKPEGNLLNDRFRNLLVNGKIEAREPIIQPRRVKRKLTEKWTYKDFSVPV